MNKTARIALASTASLASLAAVAAATLIPAQAASTQTAISDPGVGRTLNVRVEPRLGTQIQRVLKNGERVQVSCKTLGTAVTSNYGTHATWYKLATGGYVTKSMIKPGSVNDSRLATCAAADVAKPPAQQGYQYPFTGQFRLPYAAGSRFTVTQSPFGTYTHSPNHRLGKWNMHAVDLGMPSGTTLLAPGSGKIKFAGWDTTGYGNKVLIDHGNNRCTILAHMSRINVRAGQTISTGQVVGASGNTGLSTGDHLHWGVVACNSGVSLEIPSTIEAGRSYRKGAVLVSQNTRR